MSGDHRKWSLFANNSESSSSASTSPSMTPMRRKASDSCCASSSSTSCYYGKPATDKESPPRERLFEILVNEDRGGGLQRRRRRKSDSNAVLFNRILTPEQHQSLMAILYEDKRTISSNREHGLRDQSDHGVQSDDAKVKNLFSWLHKRKMMKLIQSTL